MNDIFEKDRSGAMVSPDEPGYDRLIASIFETMKLAYELNDGFRTPDEARRYLSRITGREIDESVTLLPPLNSEEHPNRLGSSRDARSSTAAGSRWATTCSSPRR